MNLLPQIPLFGPEGEENYPPSVGLRGGYRPLTLGRMEQEMAPNQWMKLTPPGPMCFRAIRLNHSRSALRGKPHLLHPVFCCNAPKAKGGNADR